ncbi:MAG: GIY-YIG nuclease family protein [Melioribacteraceae bacterium]|nr:GIY-YIG nuclease family protein [Melioribacteraceae bacterium]
MFTVYALKSISHKFIYVGMTTNLDERLHKHNSGFNKSTKPYKPFRLIYTEEFESSIKARIREKQLKTGKGKKFLYSLIEQE